MILFHSGFEDGDLQGFYWYQNEPKAVSSGHPVRDGIYSMRSYLHHYDSQHSYRTMVIVNDDDQKPPDSSTTPFRFTIGNEYWIGLSIYLQSDWVDDVDHCGDLIWQFQASPDDGEPYRSPVLAIFVDQDQYELMSKWDSRSFSPDNTWTGGKTLWSGPLAPDKGRWVDWVINIKWSWQSDGYIKVWKDGQVIAERSGPNCSNDDRGPYTSFGVYKWPWKPGNEGKYPESLTDDRLVYYDEFRIGDADANYEDVAPGGEIIVEDPREVIIAEALALRDEMRLPMPLDFAYPRVLREHEYSQGAGFGHTEINGEMWGWQIGFNINGGSAVAYSPESDYDATAFEELD